MLTNYLTIAWRTLRKRVGPTTINIAGLAVGLAACLLIGLWIERETSYDDFHPEAERVHRITVQAQVLDNEIHTPMVPAAIRGALVRDVPEVEAVTRLRPYFPSNVIRRDNQAFATENIWRADSTFLDVFGGFEMVRGDRSTALDGADAVVLTAPTARRIFDSIDVIGETVQVGDDVRQVTGVMADVPETSHLQVNAVVALGELAPEREDNWTGFQFFTYAKLKPGTSRAAFEDKLSGIAQRYPLAEIENETDLSPDQYAYVIGAEPLTRIHLHSDFDYLASGSIETVYTLGAIGLFILLIACINFMNLATARASERATEVGMRKALGAGRRQLAGQFLGEAVLTTAAASVLAVVAASLFLPFFNDLAGTSMRTSTFLQPTVLLSGGLLIAIVGLVSGSYPAFVLSRFSPAATLKAGNVQTSGARDRRIRQGLVIVQFAISIALLVGTLVAREQFDYIQNKRLGFDKERVLRIEQANNLSERQATFVDRLRRTPGVAAAAAGEGIFDFSTSASFWPVSETSEAGETLHAYRVGHDFVETLDIEMATGRSFDPARATDSTAVLLNQAAVEAYGWDDPTSRQITAGDSATVYDVVGVTADFHYESMRKQVAPAAFFLQDPSGGTDPPRFVYARLAPGRTTAALDEIRAVWTDVAPTAPFQYSFVDQTYDQLHRDVQEAGTLFSLFAGLAILIACLGLFGLATYTVQRRRKEIGIRKALGATAGQVVGLVSKEFVQLVAVAAVLGLPVAYYAMRQWLQDFAYRTTVGADVLVGAAVLASAVALVAIGYQALQAARLDPATTLHDE
jgi:putative ABC transport system permease protein